MPKKSDRSKLKKRAAPPPLAAKSGIRARTAGVRASENLRTRTAPEGKARPRVSPLAALLETCTEAGEAAVVLDSKRRVLAANKHAAELFGKSAANEAVGISPDLFVPREEKKGYLAIFRPSPTRPTKSAMVTIDTGTAPRRYLLDATCFPSGKSGVQEYFCRFRQPVPGDPIREDIISDAVDGPDASDDAKDREAQYRAFVEASPDGVILADLETHPILANAQAVHLFRYQSAEELLRSIGSATDLFPGRDAERIRSRCTQVRNAAGAAREIVQATRRDGTRFTADVGVTRFRAGAEGAYILLLIRDITEQKEMEIALREHADSYYGLFNSVTDAIYIQDREGRFLDVNEGALTMYGYEKEELIGRTPEMLSAPGKNEGVDLAAIFDRVFAGLPQAFEWWGRRKNGEIFPKDVMLNRGLYFGQEVMFAIARDISERKKAQEELLRREKRYRTLFDINPSGIMIEDTRGTILEVNDALLSSLQYSRADMIGNPVHMLVPEEDHGAVDEHIARILSGETLLHEVRNIRGNGSLAVMELRETLFKLPDGRDGILVIVNDVTDRRRLEEERRVHASQTELVLHSVPIVFYTAAKDAHYTTIWINGRIRDLTGFSAEDFTGDAHFWEERIHPADRASAMRDFSGTSTDAFTSFEYRWRCADGSYKWFLDRTILLEYPGGGASVIVGVWFDIDERKLAEEAQRKREEQYRAVVENAEAIIALVDASGRCSFMNEYGMRLLGIDAERRAAQLFLDIYPVPDPEQLMRDVREAILSREGVTVEHSLRLPEADHLFRSAIRPVRDPDGQVRTALIFARDITHQREADEFRRRESAIGLAITELYGQIVSPKPSLDGITRAILRHACALTESPHGFVCSFSAEGKRAITAVSEQLMTDLGLDERDLPIRHVCSDSGLMPPLIEDVITSCNAQFSNRTQETPYRLMIPPGEMAIYRLLSVPITIDGEVLGQISVANASRDYTEMDTDSVVRLALYYALAIQRLRLQAESVHAKERAEQSERLKDTFIANMSHEIRTPLNIIRGYSEIISGRLSGRIEVQEREYLMSIERAGERLLRTVEHILNISSMQAGTFALNSQPINLVEKIDQIVQDMRSPAMEKGLDIRCGHDAPGLWIRADHYCIDQALLNILDNAIKFTDQGIIDIRSRREKEEACIMLRDTGIGISEEYLPRLYDTFSQEVAGYTRPFEGLGLGLALTKQYVSINGGSISVHSAKGVGTTVTLRFPAIDVPAEVPTARVPSPAPPASLFPRTILVVEDDEPSQELIKILLGKEHRLLISANAEDAWNLLQLEKIDLVLMDLSLRGKIDGLQLTAVIRGVERFRELPIIATTAHAFPRDRQRCLDAGCSEYLSKPFRREDLFALIHQFLPNP